MHHFVRLVGIGLIAIGVAFIVRDGAIARGMTDVAIGVMLLYLRLYNPNPRP